MCLATKVLSSDPTLTHLTLSPWAMKKPITIQVFSGIVTIFFNCVGSIMHIVASFMRKVFLGMERRDWELDQYFPN